MWSFRNAKVIWSESASRNLIEAHSYLQGYSPDAANRAVLTIRSRVNMLLNYPRSGRIASTSKVDQRELIIPFGSSGYIALYSIQADDIVIHALRHQKQAGFSE